MWKDLDDDPEVQAKIASGRAGRRPQARPRADRAESARPSHSSPTRKEGRNSALAFLARRGRDRGLRAVPRPAARRSRSTARTVPIDMTTHDRPGHVRGRRRSSCFVGRPDVKTVPDQSVFKAGMISAIALFGIAWLTATFIAAHEEYIIEHRRRVGHELGVHLRPGGVPRGRADDEPVDGHPDDRADRPRRRASRPASSPACGPAPSAASTRCPPTAPRSPPRTSTSPGTTKLGTKLLDHSFFVPMLVLSVDHGRRRRADRRRLLLSTTTTHLDIAPTGRRSPMETQRDRRQGQRADARHPRATSRSWWRSRRSPSRATRPSRCTGWPSGPWQMFREAGFTNARLMEVPDAATRRSTARSRDRRARRSSCSTPTTTCSPPRPSRAGRPTRGPPPTRRRPDLRARRRRRQGRARGPPRAPCGSSTASRRAPSSWSSRGWRRPRATSRRSSRRTRSCSTATCSSSATWAT